MFRDWARRIGLPGGVVMILATLLASPECVAGDSPAADDAAIRASLKEIRTSGDYTEIESSSEIAIDLRYDSTNNFTHSNLYGPYDRLYLHRMAAVKLERAARLLAARKPGYKLLVFDGLRPRSVQIALWAIVKGTSQEPYVANPVTGSIHNYGFAVDLSILDDRGRELDMGTSFDDFRPLAQPKLEEQYLQRGELLRGQLDNRHLLRGVMEEAGFRQLPLEWWHYDALSRSEVKAKYRIVE